MEQEQTPLARARASNLQKLRDALREIRSKADETLRQVEEATNGGAGLVGSGTAPSAPADPRRGFPHPKAELCAKENTEPVRAPKWACVGCNYTKHFTRSVPMKTAVPCPKCGSVLFTVVPLT